MAEHIGNTRIGFWVDDLRLGVKEGLKTAAALKVESVGLDTFGPEVAPRLLSHTARRDLRRYIGAQGVALAALRADVGGRRLADAQQLDTNLSRIQEAVQLAADLGAARLVVPAGYVPPVEETARRVLTEAAQALCAFAAHSSVRVCWLGGSEAPEALTAFLQAADASGMLEADLNPGAYVMRGTDPLKALNALAARVAMATVADHYRGGAEAPFGQGDVRWGEVLVGLSTLKRSSPVDVLAACTLEGARVPALTAACARLKVLRANPLG
jgi:sugar phosphate isomerase/epimerase